MLSRYQMKRGVKKEHLPAGIRQDTRKHTRHILRPPTQLVLDYLSTESKVTWNEFRQQYRRCIEQRYSDKVSAFDALADLARGKSVYLGCSCPSSVNPRVDRCHTWLALEFMKAHYPNLEVNFPEIELSAD